jgi:hypothetical protein
VNGRGEKNKYQLQLGRWLNLAEFDPNISHLVYGVLKKYDLNNIVGASKGSVMYGLSLLIKYYNIQYTFENYFRVYPNPVQDYINVQVKKKFISPVVFSLFNNNGEALYQKRFTTLEKNAIIEFPASKWNNGLLHLVIQTNDQVVQKKVLVSRRL